MADPRPPSGRFAPGRSGNPKGRPRKTSSVGEVVRKAMDEKVTVKDQGKLKRISKLQAAATHLANKGASGDLRAGKMVLDAAQKAEVQTASLTPTPEHLSHSDEAIVTRLIARLRLIDAETRHDPPDL